jgi:hypothetical protein
MGHVAFSDRIINAPSYDILLRKPGRKNPRAKPRQTVCETVDRFLLVLYWAVAEHCNEFLVL